MGSTQAFPALVPASFPVFTCFDLPESPCSTRALIAGFDVFKPCPNLHTGVLGSYRVAIVFPCGIKELRNPVGTAFRVGGAVVPCALFTPKPCKAFPLALALPTLMDQEAGVLLWFHLRYDMLSVLLVCEQWRLSVCGRDSKSNRKSGNYEDLPFKAYALPLTPNLEQTSQIASTTFHAPH